MHSTEHAGAAAGARPTAMPQPCHTVQQLRLIAAVCCSRRARTQNGLLKAKIEGSNAPLLSTQIMALVPANADMDDLEVRKECTLLVVQPHWQGALLQAGTWPRRCEHACALRPTRRASARTSFYATSSAYELPSSI